MHNWQKRLTSSFIFLPSPTLPSPSPLLSLPPPFPSSPLHSTSLPQAAGALQDGDGDSDSSEGLPQTMLEIDFETVVDDEDIIDEFHTFKSTLERAYCMVLFPLPLFPLLPLLFPPTCMCLQLPPFSRLACLSFSLYRFSISSLSSSLLYVPATSLLILICLSVFPSANCFSCPSFLLPCSMFLLRLFFLSISLTAIYIFIFYSSFVSTPPPSPSLPPSLDPSALLCSPPPSLPRHSSQYCLGRIWSGTVS